MGVVSLHMFLCRDALAVETPTDVHQAHHAIDYSGLCVEDLQPGSASIAELGMLFPS